MVRKKTGGLVTSFVCSRRRRQEEEDKEVKKYFLCSLFNSITNFLASLCFLSALYLSRHWQRREMRKCDLYTIPRFLVNLLFSSFFKSPFCHDPFFGMAWLRFIDNSTNSCNTYILKLLIMRVQQHDPCQIMMFIISE